MYDSEDGDFYARREKTQRMLAARALDPAIAAIHMRMADEYATLVARPTRPSLRLVV